MEGRRSADWLKIKNQFIEEAIIVGYTAPRGGRRYFGALVLGAYDGKELKYIGHTGTGFSDVLLKELYEKMQPLIIDKGPFKEAVKVNAPVTWLQPKLVANVKFSQITNAGIRRHPVFEGLRIDKTEKEVTMENSKLQISNSKEQNSKSKKESSKLTKDTREVTLSTRGEGRGDVNSKSKNTNSKNAKARGEVRGEVNITNPDKIYWKKEGITKGEMIDYYNAVYKYIIPYQKDRPQSLNRFPNGIDGSSFYHKDAGENAPDFVDTYPVWSESAKKTVDYIVCNNKPSLLYIANLGCIELNPWNSRTASPDKPDYLVMDLDPSVKNSFDEVVDCALVIKEIFDSIKVKSYCKTSGSTGLHVYVPLQAKYDYAHARNFAELIAHHVLEQLPDTTTMERSLSKRKKSHIYVDYLQNKQGATLSSAYSLRPKPNAPVSTPLDWNEVKHGLDPRDYNIKNTMARLGKKVICLLRY